MSAIGLPAHILALFVPREPLEYLRPIDPQPHNEITGLSEYVHHFERKCDLVPQVPVETPKDRRARKKREAEERNASLLRDLQVSYDPNALAEGTEDPYRTLFVGRLSFDTTERTLKKEFEEYGRIEKVKIVYDKQGESRGYGFVEFESERSMRDAYKMGDGKRIDGRKVLVDVERGRTVKGWLPRRLGGGKGGRMVKKL